MRVLRALVVVVVLSISVGLAACGGGGGSGETVDVATATPREVVEAVSLDGVHSGQLEVSVEVDKRQPKEQATMRILGGFMGVGKEDPPQFDMAIESNGSLDGRELEYSAGLSLLPDRAVIYDAPNTYEPDKATFEELKSRFQDAQQGGGAGNAMACVEAGKGMEITDLADNFAGEAHRQDAAGKTEYRVNADFDLHRAVDALIQLMEDPACGAQLKAIGVPSVAVLDGLKAVLTGPVELELAVDKRGVIREIYVDGEGLATKPGRFKLGKNLEAEFRFHLSDVNEVTELPLPSGSTSFGSLLKRSGGSVAAVRMADGDELFEGFLRAVSEDLTGR